MFTRVKSAGWLRESAGSILVGRRASATVAPVWVPCSRAAPRTCAPGCRAQVEERSAASVHGRRRCGSASSDLPYRGAGAKVTGQGGGGRVKGFVDDGGVGVGGDGQGGV